MGGQINSGVLLFHSVCWHCDQVLVQALHAFPLAEVNYNFRLATNSSYSNSTTESGNSENVSS